MSVVDESTIAHPAPDDKNAVAKQVLARRAVLVGETTDSTPSVETASGASSVPPVTFIINRKRSQVLKPLRTKLGLSKRYSDDRPLTPGKPPGAAAHRKALETPILSVRSISLER